MAAGTLPACTFFAGGREIRFCSPERRNSILHAPIPKQATAKFNAIGEGKARMSLFGIAQITQPLWG
jgi:hypothetical protein